MYQILVLCTANVCRSPAFQVFLRHALLGNNAQVDSAGTLAIDGNPPDPMIQALMTERGYPEIADHRSRALLPSYLTKYQLILCMEQDHMERVRRLSVLALGKAMLVGHWDGRKEISDPIGQAQEVYEAALVEMQKCSNQWAAKLIDMGMVA